MTNSKMKLYKTARIINGTTVFNPGQVVSVCYIGNIFGVPQFDCCSSSIYAPFKLGKQDVHQVQPVDNLTGFVL